jgi:hypothetical protein
VDPKISIGPALYTIVAAAILAFFYVSGRSHFVSGTFPSPNITNDVRRLLIGRQQFEIPGNYLPGDKLFSGEHGGRFIPVNEIAIEGLAPGFEPRSNENLQSFRAPNCCASVSISKEISPLSDIQSAMLKNVLTRSDLISKDDDGITSHYKIRFHGGEFWLSEYQDLYVKDDGSQLLRCNQRDMSGNRHVDSDYCTAYSNEGGLRFEISVPGNNPVEIDRHLKMIWGKLRTWMT